MSTPYTIEQNANLVTHNTMQLCCIADALITLNDESQVDSVIADCVANRAEILILSGGSNVILPSQLHAQVIKPNFKGIEILSEDENRIDIEVMAGEPWHELVVTTVSKGWYGLENLALIPGLTGAAPVQNIGAYGVQLEDCLTHVRAYHIPTRILRIFMKAKTNARDQPVTRFTFKFTAAIVKLALFFR